MRMMRCLGVMDIWCGEQHEELFNGREIDFDRVLRPATQSTPAYTVADAVAGRESMFVPVEAEPVQMDGGPAPDGFDSPIIDPADLAKMPNSTITKIGNEPDVLDPVTGEILGKEIGVVAEQFDKLERIPTATVETPGQAPIEPVTKSE